MDFFKPVGDRIVIKPDPPPTEAKRGKIILQVDKTEAEMTTGVIVGIGEEVTAPVKLGDRVLHSPYTGMMITMRGVSFKILTSYDVMGIMLDGGDAEAE